MKHKKWTRTEKILWLTPGLLLASVWGILYAPRMSRSLEATAENWGFKTPGLKQRSTCISNLKQMGLAVAMYCDDYDNRFPLASTPTVHIGWGELLRPYMMATTYHCPRNPVASLSNGISILPSTSIKFTTYYYNARLSAASSDQMSNPAQTILFGEGTSSDARYAKTQLPPQWVNGANSPARIHYEPGMATGGNSNYAFADGHVNRIQPQFIGSGSPLSGAWTFAIR